VADQPFQQFVHRSRTAATEQSHLAQGEQIAIEANWPMIAKFLAKLVAMPLA
jgi:hypothetical protein